MLKVKTTLICVDDSIFNVGVRRIASWVRYNGYNVNVIYLPLDISHSLRHLFSPRESEYTDQIIVNLAENVKDSDVLAFSCMTSHLPKIKLLINKLRQQYPQKIFVLGGMHATVLPEDAINHADIICVGEGEYVFLELIDKLSTGQDISSIKNLWIRNGSKIIRNQIRPLLTDDELDQMPVMDFGVDHNYILDNEKIIPLTKKLYFKHCGTYYRTIYTLGCTFSCTYCSNNTLKKLSREYAKIRRPSLSHLMSELHLIKSKYPFFRSIMLMDDSFFSLNEHIIYDFSERYRKEIGLPLILPGATPINVTEKKMELLISAGLFQVRVGIQSGSSNILKLYDRRTPIHRIIETSRILSKFKKRIVPPAYDFILDNPYETINDKLKTIQLLDQLAPPFTVNLFPLVFNPDVKLTNKAYKDNLINSNQGNTNGYYKKFSPIHANATYVNLLIASYGILKIPSALLSLLLKSKKIYSTKTYPLLLNLFLLLNYGKRVLHHFYLGDFHRLPGNLSVLVSKFTSRLNLIGTDKAY